MSQARKLMMAGNLDTEPLGTDLDGANDFLSRSSDFSGNADGKVFTTSFWVYRRNPFERNIITSGNPNHLLVQAEGDNTLSVLAHNTGGSLILSAGSSLTIPIKTWTHVLVSVDLANASNRSMYINDAEDSGVSWSVYTDADIGFTQSEWAIGSDISGANTLQGRLADVFLDYTYRDLTIESNRRLFTTISSSKGLVSVGGDALAVLNPIMTAFTDPEDQTLNQGTGGAWTVNGTMVRSQRGVNQFSAVAGFFDGATDYLAETSFAANSNTTLLTLSFHCSTITNGYIFSLYDSGVGTNTVGAHANATDKLTFHGNKPSPLAAVLDMTTPTIPDGRNVFIQLSMDLSDAAKRHVFIDGVDVTDDCTWTTYNTAEVFYNSLADTTRFGNKFSGDYYDGSIGEGYFDQSYIDLSVDNPFWDSTLNKPKYLGEQGEYPTGSQPLIYLPIRADDAGNNLGSKSNFTVNGSPAVGIRGISEFWSRSMLVVTAGARLINTQITADTTVANLSCVAFFKSDTAAWSSGRVLDIGGTSGFTLSQTANEDFQAFVGGQGAGMVGGPIPNPTDWQVIFCSYDGANISMVFDGVENTTAKTGTIDLSGLVGIANTHAGGFSNSGEMYSALYFSNEYIDFSDEDNRLLFVDALGFPVPLQESITNGLIPEGLIRMGFEDVDDLGANSGTGGDFTITGTITAGADVNAS